MADQMVQDQIVQSQSKVNQTAPTQAKAVEKKAVLSADGWAVAIALLLAALVRFGVLKHVAW
jgi:hypothetical protein